MNQQRQETFKVVVYENQILCVFVHEIIDDVLRKAENIALVGQAAVVDRDQKIIPTDF